MQDIVIDLCCCPVQLHVCEVPLLAHFHWLFVRANILKTRVGGINFWYVSTPFLRKYPPIPPLSLFRCRTSHCNTQQKIQACSSPPNSLGYLSELFCSLRVGIKKDRVSSMSLRSSLWFCVVFLSVHLVYHYNITCVVSNFFHAHEST